MGNGCGDSEGVNSWTVDLPADPKPDVQPPMPPSPGKNLWNKKLSLQFIVAMFPKVFLFQPD